MKKLADILGTTLIVLLAVALAAVVVPKLVFGVEMKAVLSPSMEPELPVGSLLVIVPAEYDDIQIGDDITYVLNENLDLVTHRVVAKNPAEQKITTAGIANDGAIDAPTGYENVLGRVSFHIPLLGYLVIWLSSLKGKIIAGIIVVTLLLISLLVGRSKRQTQLAPARPVPGSVPVEALDGLFPGASPARPAHSAEPAVSSSPAPAVPVSAAASAAQATDEEVWQSILAKFPELEGSNQ